MLKSLVWLGFEFEPFPSLKGAMTKKLESKWEQSIQIDISTYSGLYTVFEILLKNQGKMSHFFKNWASNSNNHLSHIFDTLQHKYSSFQPQEKIVSRWVWKYLEIYFLKNNLPCLMYCKWTVSL